jgi:mono/diheme cytochrome c family protein
MPARAALIASAIVAVSAATPAAAADGQALFLANCSACHQATGLGVPGAFPALAGDKFVVGDGKTVAHVVLFGRGGMPAFKGDLGDADIAAILTYVRSAWGNKAAPLTPEGVAAARAGAPPPVHTLQAH